MSDLTKAVLAFLLLTCIAEGKDRAYRDPLLQTHWSQRGPYAALTPNNERLGCWSVAFAQILYYHRLQPQGSVEYEGRGYKVSERFRPRFEWGLFADALSDETPNDSRMEVARYCYYTALAVKKDFAGGESYKGNSDLRRAGVEEHFRCKTQRFSDDRDGKEGVEEAIISELKQKRPLLLYAEGTEGGLGHAFAIDGAKEKDGRLQVHLNCGWSSPDDGWFDFWEPFATSRGVFDKPGRWVLAIRP